MVLLALPAQSFAQLTEGAGCDPAFGTVLENAAWKAGEREIEVAEKLILKPDSVLQYTCFPANSPYRQVTSMIVGNYVGSNFAKQGFVSSALAAGDLAGSQLCVQMAAVWSLQKCADFDIDDFRTYAELAAADPRTTYATCPNQGERQQRWADAIAAANPPPAVPAAAGGMDQAVTYNNWIWSGNCNAVEPVPTGVIIKLLNGDEYEDAACSVPGCSYDRRTNRCVASDPQ